MREGVIRTSCSWLPELGSIEYAFRYELLLIQRKPVKRIVSRSPMLSQKEIERALDLVGRNQTSMLPDGYDAIIVAPSWWEIREDLDTDEERAEFRLAWQRLSGVRCGRYCTETLSGRGGTAVKQKPDKYIA